MVIAPETVFALTAAGFVLWSLSLIGFFASIDKKYLHTFFDFASAKQYSVGHFFANTEDQEKIKIFDYHPSFYASIHKDIKEWIGGNYPVWVIERPAWFTDDIIARIPSEFLPEGEEAEVEADEQGGEGQRGEGRGGRHSLTGKATARVAPAPELIE